MANGQTSFIGGANLRRSGLPVLSAGCQGFRRHDGNRRHELRSLAVHASASIGGNSLDLWFLDGTQPRNAFLLHVLSRAGDAFECLEVRTGAVA